MRRFLRPPAPSPRRRPRQPSPHGLLELLESRTLFAAGDLDPTFGAGGPNGNGVVTTNIATVNTLPPSDSAQAVLIQSDNKILVGGSSDGGIGADFALARYNCDGSLDTSFDSDGKAFVDFFEGADTASDVKVDIDNNIIVVGSSAPPGSYRRFVLVRFNSDGSPDATFGDLGKAAADFGGTAYGKDVVIDPAGKYIVGGLVDAPGGSTTDDFAVARFNNNGTLDTAFGTGGTVRTSVSDASASAGADVALQADGKIVMAGDATFAATGSDFAVVRYVNAVAVPGSISGTVFEDRNHNGVLDATEPGLSGWTVFQDLNDNGTLDTGNATINSTDVPKPIPDVSSTTSELTVGGLAGDITDVNVTLTIDHTFDPDLRVTLISPSGTRVLLFNDVGHTGSNANFNNTTLDDQATRSIVAGQPPFPGSYRPQESLSKFSGENPTGVWKLEVTDTAAEDTGTLQAWSLTLTTRGEPSTTTAADGSYSFTNLPSGTYTVREVVKPGFTQTAPPNGAAHVVTVAEGQQVVGRNFGNFQGTVPPEVVGRRVFYNNSSFDGRSAAPDLRDVLAVAADKEALLPGELGTFANVTSYVRGINGILVELRNLAPGKTLGPADFQFRVGNSPDPAGWGAAPAPAQVVTLRSPIPEDPARVHITWPDGAILNKWLQVTMLANANSGLLSPDVFYFGNLIGETGDQPSRLVTVTQRDEILVRRELRTRGASVTNHFDFDRDGDVDGMDVLTVRRNIGARLSALGGPDTAAIAGAPGSPFSDAPTPAERQRVWDEQPAPLL